MKSLADSIVDICANSPHTSSAAREYESASALFDSLIAKGWATKRENQLLPDSERFKNTVLINK